MGHDGADLRRLQEQEPVHRGRPAAQPGGGGPEAEEGGYHAAEAEGHAGA